VKDLDRQVLALLTQYFLLLLLEDLAGAVMRVDDAIADLVVEEGRLTAELEVRNGLVNSCFGNGGPPSSTSAVAPCVMFASSGPRG
jgi:hypothetical protein